MLWIRSGHQNLIYGDAPRVYETRFLHGNKDGGDDNHGPQEKTVAKQVAKLRI
jgi:hypothetical protein